MLVPAPDRDVAETWPPLRLNEFLDDREADARPADIDIAAPAPFEDVRQVLWGDSRAVVRDSHDCPRPFSQSRHPHVITCPTVPGGIREQVSDALVQPARIRLDE